MIICVEIKGLGNIPSFKNKKMLARGRLITNPKTQQWMQECIRALESQLSSACQTKGLGTSPECLKQFAIACVPLDDNWLELEIGKASCKFVESGEEGAAITIERIM